MIVNDNLKALQTYISNVFNSAKQICLCQNDPNLAEKDIEDYYGFAKPRMWDQYADNYNGLCIAFSKKKLVKKKIDVMHGAVEYFHFSNLVDNHFNLENSKFENIGSNGYHKEINSKIRKVFLSKHKDYEHESEYKFISTKHDNKDVFLDVSDCILAIIVPTERISKYSLLQLNKYIKDLEIHGIAISWRENGLIINPIN